MSTLENYSLNSINAEKKFLLDEIITKVDQKILGYPDQYVTDAQKIFLLLENIDQKPSKFAWFSYYLLQNPAHRTNYSACVTALKQNYPIPLPLTKITRSQLYKLNQESLSISEYNNKFDSIVTNSNISFEEQKYYYFKGLNPNIKLFTNNEVDTVENIKKSALKAEEKVKSLNLVDSFSTNLNN